MTLVLKSFAFITVITSLVVSGLHPSSPHRQAGNPTAVHAAAVASGPDETLDDPLFAAKAHHNQAPPQEVLLAAPVAAPAAPAPVAAPVRQPVSAPPAPAPPPPPIVIGSTQQALINQDRAAAGLRPLNWSPCLAGIAAGQAQAMASAGSIFHGNGVQKDWGCSLGSSQTGENVGVWGAAINDAGINQLFMSSATHRANILGPYRYVGTAWVVSGGKGYIAVEFG